MKIKTLEYDTTALWTMDSVLYLDCGRWANGTGIDKGGVKVPGAIVEHPLPSADDPHLRISWPEITVQALLEQVKS